MLLLCNPLIAHGDEKYLCICEHATGFSYNASSKSWESAVFKADSKFIISQSDAEDCRFKITRVGERYPEFMCKKGFSKDGYLYCFDVFGGEFRFNKKNGRFLMTYLLGYFNAGPGLAFPTDEQSDTPLIAIGVCSPF